MKWLLLFSAAVLSGTVASMGLGGGGVLLIFLTVFAGTEQLRAQGINLLFFIPIGVFSTVIYAVRGKIKWRTVLITAAFGLVGVAMGSLFAELIGSQILSKIFGMILIIMGMFGFFVKDKEDKSAR